MFTELEELEADPACVYPNLFLGSELGASDVDRLKMLSVTRVLVVAPCRRPPGHDDSGILYKDLWIDDSSRANLLEILMEAIEFLKGASDTERALVHCHAGVSRSAAVAIAFIMHQEKKSFDESFNIVKRFRPAIDPNRGFVEQLKMFEKLGCTIDKDSSDYADFFAKMRLEAARKFGAIVLHIHPESDEVDLKTLEADIRGFGSGDGITWGESRHEPIAFGISKIVIALSFEVNPELDINYMLEEELPERFSMIGRVEIVSRNYL